MEKSICVFGDSTAWGAWDKEKGGWVNRLWLDLAEKNNGMARDKNSRIWLYNLSQSGGTIEDTLARFEKEAKARGANTLLFQTGGNETAHVDTKGNYKFSPEKFKSHLEQIIKKAKKVTQEVIVIGFNNVNEMKTTPVFWRDIYWTNKKIKRYNTIIKNTCAKNNVLFIEIFGILKREDLHYDGLHPNAKGHEKIFQTVKNFLEKNKIL